MAFETWPSILCGEEDKFLLSVMDHLDVKTVSRCCRVCKRLVSFTHASTCSISLPCLLKILNGDVDVFSTFDEKMFMRVSIHTRKTCIHRAGRTIFGAMHSQSMLVAVKSLK
jgi:hypothetical protein